MRLTRGIAALCVIVMMLVNVDVLFSQEPAPGAGEKKVQVAQAAAPVPPDTTPISLDFKEADIQTVLQALARKAKVNIVTGKEVSGLVTIHLEDVTWEQALDTISKTYGYGYEKDGNVILVSTLEELKSRREAMKELVEIEEITTKVITLNYLDAADVKKFLEPQLSPRGRISVLEITGQKGWDFGIGAVGSSGTTEEDRQRYERERARSKSIVITDTPTTIERLERILAEIDILPRQVLIEARAMEVDRDLLRDIDFGLVTGATQGGTSLSLQAETASKRGGTSLTEFAATQIQSSFTPAVFLPETTGLTAAAAGSQFLFSKLRGTQFTALLQLLEEDVRTNTLSAPNVLTVSGQEARILVGEKYPILQTQVSGTSTTTTTTTLDYYQNIGIELYVVPQVVGDRHIDMIVHPVVSARTTTVGSNAYPILNVRETETQIVIESGDTIVIGGLLKDVKSKSKIGLPFLGKLPLVGPLFARTTQDLEKIDLLIFITARIVEPGLLSADQTEQLQRQYEEFWRRQVREKPREWRKKPEKKKEWKPTASEPDLTAKPAAKTKPAAQPAAKPTGEAEPVRSEQNRGILYQKK